MKTIDREILHTSLRKLIHRKVSTGRLLIGAALLAVILVNSPWGYMYDHLLNSPVSLQIGTFNLFSHHGATMTLLEVINDALMAIFFLSVGLEIKREVVAGELSNPKKAMLPVVAACGGMITPVFLYFLLSPSGEAMRGAAIPMATDIAFSLGILALLGNRVPLCLKIFLTTLAVVDDIGGIIVIALFYSSHIYPGYLLIIFLLLALLFVAGRHGMNSKMFYLTGFVVIWFLMLQSGVHATIAGVLVAITIPAKPKVRLSRFVNDLKRTIAVLPEKDTEKDILTNSQISILKYIEHKSDKVISPLQSLDDNLSPLVYYFIMPLFAFANAGISFEGFSITDFGGITSAIIFSMVVGKLTGIFSFTWLSVKWGWLTLPDQINFRQIFGVAILGGIGFTVSLFIASLSFTAIEGGATLLNNARLGIFTGSILAGVTGYLYLRNNLPERI
ncbi:MAG: Na+/H+ antiporter NhaA [Bacteroides sp.]|nr:Na+/H+ antiporter NhaA [Bacteroides sp.]